ncbi:hypothetical protein P7K49_015080 [Saguinus oedipus]|uniref:Uncharacterized protein n=1 Tax=Saguinus oedipus TaxID=9490 RepID=A0ABQ9V882_SAGOE|nr:hypothetical protein P7K49_015080 [Saguinus oedipus]
MAPAGPRPVPEAGGSGGRTAALRVPLPCLGLGWGIEARAGSCKTEGLVQPHLPLLLSHQNRGRLADKRTVTLPAARSPKKERTPSFSASDGDSDGSGPTCGRQPGLKREDGPHIHIMKRRYQDPGPAGRRKARRGPAGASGLQLLR